MKWILVVCALCVSGLAGAAHANVGVFSGNGHSIELSSTEDIQMVSEDVTIIPGRGRFLFDGSVPGMDRVEYDCTFVLKNRKTKAVNIQVGFPLDSQFLSAPYDNKKKTSEMVARYAFIAQEEEHQYSVRYVAGDRAKKLKNVFLWAMSFAPEETKTLRVTYAMPMSMSVATTALDREASDYGKDWYRSLEDCMLEWFGYVTATGQSWSGPIKRARFRVYVEGFEKYIRQRPFLEVADPAERAKSRERFPVWLPMVLRATSPNGWKPNGLGFLELSYENYEPDENLKCSYYILSFPRTTEGARRLMDRLSPDGLSTEDRQDLADIFREFNGTKTGNKRIAKFLKNQVWFGHKPQMKIPDGVIKSILRKKK